MSERHKDTTQLKTTLGWLALGVCVHVCLLVCVCTVIGHGEDGDLRDGTVTSFYSPGSLVDGCQICVHVARETSAARHLLSGCRHLGNSERNNSFPHFLWSFQNRCTEIVADLSESLCVGAHISEDDEDVLLTLIGQILCCCQS